MDSSASVDLGTSIAWHGIEEELSFEWQVPLVHVMCCGRAASAISMLATRTTILVLTPTLKSHLTATALCPDSNSPYCIHTFLPPTGLS